MELFEYYLFLGLRKLALSMTYHGAGSFGEMLGSLMFRFTSFRIKVTLENLAHAFPRLHVHDHKAIAHDAYRNYGRALLEMLWASGQDEETLRSTVSIANREIIDRVFQQEKGMILLSGHYGNWEFIVQGLRLHIGRPFSILVQQQRNGLIHHLIDTARTRFGNSTISMGVSSREAFRVLHQKGILALLGDQSGPREAVFVEFFGRPAATHRGAAAFSLKTHTPLVMVFLIRAEDGSYQATFEEVSREGLDEYTEENIVELTRRHTVILERYIRLHPDHWLWMHKRWKHTNYYQSRSAQEHR